MLGYELEVEGLDEQLLALRQHDAIADDELERAMEQATLTGVGAIRPLMPVGVSGQARQSVKSRVTRASAGAITGEIFADIRDPYPYPAVIEFGRQPGRMPPPEALERWVQLKMGVSADDAPGVAFTVARAIGRRGVKGRFPFKRGWESVAGRVSGFFAAALRRITERLANG